MVVDKPKLIYQAKVERKNYIRRFLWSVLAIVAAWGAWVALDQVAARGLMDGVLIEVGKVVALGVVALYIVRGFANLLRGLRAKNENVRFYDRGFRWVRGKEESKYSWSDVTVFRQGIRQMRLGKRVLFESGAHTFKMRDGKVFKFTTAHGDSRQFLARVRPFISDMMGEKIGRALRNGKTVRVHPQVALVAEGIEVGELFIMWQDADVKLQGKQVVISRREDDDSFKPVKSINVNAIDNLGGFIEIAQATIKNHQPERFNIKVQKPTYERSRV